jgi:carbon-monoxide dehydrogenase large subunit
LRGNRIASKGGAVAPPAAIANAVADALAPFGAEFNAAPIKPQQVLEAICSGLRP